MALGSVRKEYSHEVKEDGDLKGFIFDMQRFAEDGGDDGAGEAEPKIEYIDKKDPETGQSFKIPKDLEPIIGHFISSTRKEVEKRYKPMVEALESEKAEFGDIKAEYEKLKEANMTAEERAQANAKRVIEEHERKTKAIVEESEKYRQLFFDTTKRNDIMSAFAGFDLCNPMQTAILLEAEGRARVEEKIDNDGKPTGFYETRITLNIQNDKGETETIDGTPEELFKRWINLDRNLHHIKNPLNPGAGTRHVNGKTGKQDFSNLSPVERMRAARGR
jgi:hypothetical protein